MTGAVRRVLQTIHLWVGLILAIPLVVIGISGSALLLQREIVARSMPAPTATGETAPIASLVRVAQGAAGEREVGSIRVSLPGGDGIAVAIQLAEPGRGNRGLAVYLDPVSAEILGTEETVARGPIQRFLINVHGFLLLPPPTGIPVVGALGIVLIFMSVTGLILWWPRKGGWRRALTISRGARGLRLHLDLHHAVGFWSFAVLLIVSISGVYLCFPQSFSIALRAVLPGGQSTVEADAGYVAPSLPLDADKIIAAAMTAVRDARPITLSMPAGENVPFVVEMETIGLSPKSPPVYVMFDAESGDLAFIDDPRSYAIGSKLLNWQHAIHFGLGFGWVWKIILFLSGFLPLLLAITGTYIWWMKRANRANMRGPQGAAQPVPEPGE